jgi:hypothetical protein
VKTLWRWLSYILSMDLNCKFSSMPGSQLIIPCPNTPKALLYRIKWLLYFASIFSVQKFTAYNTGQRSLNLFWFWILPDPWVVLCWNKSDKFNLSIVFLLTHVRFSTIKMAVFRDQKHRGQLVQLTAAAIATKTLDTVQE